MTEASALSALALRSKAHWGYSPEFIAACRDEMTVSTATLQQADLYYVVALQQNILCGFYALQQHGNQSVELGAMFVEPAMIGKGIGRALLNRARQQANALGARRMIIQSDPHAADFYRSTGAHLIGQRASGSIPGRWLPELQLDLP